MNRRLRRVAVGVTLAVLLGLAAPASAADVAVMFSPQGGADDG